MGSWTRWTTNPTGINDPQATGQSIKPRPRSKQSGLLGIARCCSASPSPGEPCDAAPRCRTARSAYLFIRRGECPKSTFWPTKVQAPATPLPTPPTPANKMMEINRETIFASTAEGRYTIVLVLLCARRVLLAGLE